MQTELMNVRPAQATLGAQSLGTLLEQIVERGVTAESAVVVEKMLAVYRECQADAAKAEFNADFAALQADLVPVQAVKAVPNNDGTIRYRYAPFETLMAQVKPLLAKHGFAVSFDCDFKDNRVDVTCTLTHSGGHSRTNRFAARVGKGPPGTNEAQADGAARTYARRLALCDALNIVVEQDTDARSEGEAISAEEAADIEARVEKVTGGDEARIGRLLKLGGAEDFRSIRRVKYRVVVDALERAEAMAEKDAKAKARPPAIPGSLTPDEIARIHAEESREGFNRGS